MTHRYKAGEHPRSLANLIPGQGRPSLYDQTKKQRTLTVTQVGWDGARIAITKAGYKGVSDFLEKLGRGEAVIAQAPVSPMQGSESATLQQAGFESVSDLLACLAEGKAVVKRVH